VVAHGKASVQFLDRPGRREAAGCHCGRQGTRSSCSTRRSDIYNVIDVTAIGRRGKLLGNVAPCRIGAAITAGYWFLWVRCPACRTTNAIDLRTLDRHRDAAVTSLIPSLSCRSCRPNAPFAELVRLSRTSIADEMRIEHTRRVLGE
jgi:hypothetical protein